MNHFLESNNEDRLGTSDTTIYCGFRNIKVKPFMLRVLPIGKFNRLKNKKLWQR